MRIVALVVSLSSQTTALIVMIGGVVVPIVTSFLKKENWAPPIKQAIAMAVSAGIGCGAIAIDQPKLLTGGNITTIAALIFAVATIAYGTIFKGSNFDQVLTAFPKKAPLPPPVL